MHSYCICKIHHWLLQLEKRIGNINRGYCKIQDLRILDWAMMEEKNFRTIHKKMHIEYFSQNAAGIISNEYSRVKSTGETLIKVCPNACIGARLEILALQPCSILAHVYQSLAE